MLRAVRHQVLHRPHNLIEEGIPVDQGAEAGDLASNGSPYLSLAVLEQFYKGGDEIPGNHLLIDRFGNLHTQLVSLFGKPAIWLTDLFEPVGNHVPDSPALVLYQAA